MGCRTARELTLAPLLGPVNAKQREDVGGVIVHGQLGSRLRAPSRLDSAGKYLLANADHAVTEGVVGHERAKVGAKSPVDPLILLNGVVVHREAAHDHQPATADDLLVDPLERPVELYMAAVLAAHLIPRQRGCAHHDVLERSDLARREVERDGVLVPEVAARPGDRMVNPLSMDLGRQFDLPRKTNVRERFSAYLLAPWPPP